MENIKFRKVVIIGVGLIGGAIGKALLEGGIAREVVGVFRRSSSFERAEKAGAIISGTVNEYEGPVKGADLVVIATPVNTIKDMLDELARYVKDDTLLVTDAGSTKKEITEHASRYMDKFVFIGSHPLAGSEKTGVENARSDLFDGSVCIITPDKQRADARYKDATDKLQDFWKALGSKVFISSPEEHDENLAFSSHLPHAVSSALAGVMWNRCPYALFSTGFEDTTRIASSDPDLWSGILSSNRDNVIKAIDAFLGYLTDIRAALDSNDNAGLLSLLKRGIDTREAIVAEQSRIRKNGDDAR